MELAVKAALTVSVITALILAASWFGEFVAGLLSALPFTTVPSLLLIGLERGSSAAETAAIGGVVGCALASVFAIAYDASARRFSPIPALAISIGLMVECVCVAVRHPQTLPFASAMTCAAAAVALLVIRGRPAPARPARPQAVSRAVWSALAIGLSSAALMTIVSELSSSMAGIVAAMPVVGVAAVASRHATQGRPAVSPYLRGYVISSLVKAAFCATFAAVVLSQGIVVALLVSGGLSLMLLVAALRLDSWPCRRSRLLCPVGGRP